MRLKTKVYKPFTKDEISIRKDVIFKIIFGDNYRSQYVKALLESILHKKITNIVIRNDVLLDKIHEEDKSMRLDILAEIDGKEKINIEFQNKNEYNVISRSEAYASGIYYNLLKVGDKYIEASKTIVIWLLGFNLFKDSSNYHEIGRTRRDSDNKIISEDIEYHYIQLPKFIETVTEINTPEEQWLAYLTNSLSEEEKGELFKMNRSIEEINRIVDIVMSDKDVQDALNDRILAQNLEQLKARKAFEDGKEENTIEVVKQMLEEQLDENMILRITGITKERLEEIKQN